MEFLRKMSAKSLMGSINKPEKQVDLFAVTGIANDIKTGTSTYGDWTALIGQFEGANVETGEGYISTQLYLPEPMNSVIAERIKAGDTGVEFGVIIGVKPADNAFGYEYTTKPIVQPKENDALSDLRSKMMAALPKLKDANVSNIKKESKK